MTIFSENIALFTAPALKNSRQIFRDLGLYVFSNSEESSFKEEIYSQATHIGLGEKFLAEGDENNSGKYVKMSLIGEIEEIGSFSVEFMEGKITKIVNLQSKNLNEKIFLECMQRFIEESYFMKYYGISDNLPKNWRYIFVKPENIISLSENILYPSKSLVSFSLNTDNTGKYIEAKDIINTIKISENVYLDIKNKNLLVKNFSDNIKKGEILLANNLKKVPLGEDNKDFYANLLEKIIQYSEGFSFKDFTEFEGISPTDYAEKKKAFSRANFSNYLDFDITISARGFVTKTLKKEKK